MTLEIPPELEIRLRSLADQKGETVETFALSYLEKLAPVVSSHAAADHGAHETREERRARINKAIDEAQSAFAPIHRVFGDPVAALIAEKRADEERAEQRGF